MQVSQMKRAVSQAQWKQRIVECRNLGVPVKECAGSKESVIPPTTAMNKHC